MAKAIWLAAFAFLTVAYAQIDIESSCVLEDDKCTCVRQEKSLCVKPEEDGTCFIDECKEGWQCDCTGVDLCDIVDSTAYLTNGTASVREFDRGDRGIECRGVPVRVPKTEAPVCEFEGQVCDQACLWSVQVGGQPYPCIRAIAISDQTVEEWYGLQDFATSVTEGLRHNYINVRIANHTDTNQFYFCSIYSDGIEVESDSDTKRRVTATITTEYTMDWQVRDDPSDIYTSLNSTTLQATHIYNPSKSDGFCVGPINYRLGAVTVNYEDLVEVEGLQFQASENGEIKALDPPVSIRPGQTEVGPIVFRPNCFLDCLAALAA